MLRNIIIAILAIYSIGASYLLLEINNKQKQALSNKHTSSIAVAHNVVATRTPQQNIIINAIPKSGSAYIAQALENGLHYQHATISNEYIPYDQVNYKKVKAFFSTGAKLSKQHMEPSGINMQILRRFTDRIVLNVRDPREVLLSWVHYLNAEHAKGIDIYYVDPEPPAEYYQLSLQQQIDWNIQNFLPSMVKWLQAWSDYKKSQDLKQNGLKILVVKYDDLVEDEAGLYGRILQFYNIPESDFVFVRPEKSTYLHFRNGDRNEWRSVFSSEQKAAIAKIIPLSLLEEFGWKE
jgi:hypothetical protein